MASKFPDFIPSDAPKLDWGRWGEKYTATYHGFHHQAVYATQLICCLEIHGGYLDYENSTVLGKYYMKCE